ncbi:3' terminal RNA ribose 2'-O-methyltransferase Hen1 [Fibrella forsythiae]|uniref:Small RNA 2'-O-methyltransferase n=1 Tax=Fibrella forsythiae TaxID=2817061 RepID=A0ABS3JRV0_9BACT|nr:3' terminal RNA ribose 2'-O-methyltransferase Hen1 [Fibrella forsythiae]MBO0952737.1 3' terminal RNA ribose 2'-O-methyltransferase Hen1 [Fibrella forsythiae]
MFLSISTTGLPNNPATDLGWLLHKRPDKVQSFAVAAGKAHVFYSEASPKRCTAAMMLTIDPVALVRGDSALQDQYVNDRPYVASSLVSTAIANVYSSALNGRCNDRPELVNVALPLTATIAVVKVKGDTNTIQRLFQPLGYTVDVVRHYVDDRFPDWGYGPYYTLTLTHTLPVKNLLTHLYVLLPILDNEKHYFVNQQEIDVLLKKGEGWLSAHPERDFITWRFLRRKASLTREALDRLTAIDPEVDVDDLVQEEAPPTTTAEQEPEATRTFISLHEQRLKAAFEVLKRSGVNSVLDLGCGEGKLLRMLHTDPQFRRIAGMDVAYRDLLRAKDRLHYDQFNESQRERLSIFQGSLLYRDSRLNGFDSATLIEVIEHVEPERLPNLERVVFEFAQPALVIVTTPNKEYNQKYGMTDDQSRHTDHRFEWSRAEFSAWCASVSQRFGYKVRIVGVGEADPLVGASSQMAVFDFNKS